MITAGPVFITWTVLNSLTIKDLAVFSEMRLEFAGGFQVFTGDTGAGKSILVEAIGLVLGEKGDVSLIRDGASEAMVEAVFDASGLSQVDGLFAEQGIPVGDAPGEVILRRVISAVGPSKILVNGQRVTLATLKRLSALLIDFTGQNQQDELLDGEHDIMILDSFLPHETPLAPYRVLWEKTQALAKTLTDLKRQALEKHERLEWLDFQLGELSQLPIMDEDGLKTLKSRRERLRHAAAVAAFTRLAAESLTDGEGGCADLLKRLKSELGKNPALSTIFSDQATQLDGLFSRVNDLAYAIARQGEMDTGEDGPVDLEKIEADLFTVAKLCRKYGPEIRDVLSQRDRLNAERDALAGVDDRLIAASAEFERTLTELTGLALALTRARVAVKQRLEQDITRELKQLNMPQVHFEVAITPTGPADQAESFHARGNDRVAFLISPNPGLKPRPLAQIASGGETSRIFLALKRILSRHRPAGTLIFDEIDSGISGATVEKVGLSLKDLARRFQVFCVTHHAKVAALADRHLLVEKSQACSSTITRVRRLEGEERVHEVARLMGGVTITQKNLDFARELMGKD